MVDRLALNIMRCFWLIQAIVLSGLLPYIKNKETYDFLEQHSMSAWMLFDNPRMLPPEMLEDIVTMGKGIIFIGCCIVIGVLMKIVKGLI